MSQIEDRIVVMRFDNKQFESGISTTLVSLEKLDKALEFKNAGDAFVSIQNGIKKVDFSPIVGALENLQSAVIPKAATWIKKNLWDDVIDYGQAKIVQLYNATIAQIKSGGITRAMNLEQAKFQLEGLKVDWEDIKDIINDAVSGTAYGLDAAAKVASQLVASNVSIIGGSASDMQIALKAISGVAAMTNSSYEDIGRIFTTVAGQGRVMGDQLNQIAARGLNAAAELAKVLHTTEAGVRDMVSKGQIDFNTFANAMYQAFGEQATKANDTFSGAMSNMKAALSRIGAEVASPGLEHLRDLFNALREVINDIHVDLMPAINGLNDFLNVITERVVGIVKAGGLQNMFNGILNILTGIKNVLFPIKETFANLFPESIVTHFTEGMSKFRKVTESFLSNSKLSFEEMMSSSGSNSIIAEMQAAYDIWTKGNLGNGQERVRILTEMGLEYQKVQDWVNKIDSGELSYLELAKMITEETKKLTEAEKEAAENGVMNEKKLGVWEAFRVVLGSIKNIFEGLNNIFTVLKQTVSVIFDAFNDVFSGTGIVLGVYGITDAFKKFTESLIMSEESMETLKTIIRGVFSAIDILRIVIVSVFDYLTDKLSKFNDKFGGKELLGGLVETLSGVGTFLYDFSRGLRDGYTWSEALKTAWGSIKDILHNAVVEPFNNFVGDIPNKISTVMTSVFETVTKTINKIRTKIFGFNKDTKKATTSVFGFGDKNALGTAIQTAAKDVSLVDKVLNKIKDTWNNLSGMNPDSIIIKIGNFIIKIFSAIKKTLTAEANKALGSASGSGKNEFVEILKERAFVVVDKLYETAKKFLLGVWDSIKGVFTNVKRIFDTVVQWVSDLIVNLLSNIDITRLAQGLGSIINGIGDMLVMLGQMLSDGAKEGGGLREAITQICDLVLAIVTAITSLVKNAPSSLGPLVNQIITIIGDVLDIIHIALTEVKEDPKGAMEHGMVFFLFTMIANIAEGIKNFGEASKGFAGAAAGFSNAFNNIAFSLNKMVGLETEKSKAKTTKDILAAIVQIILSLVAAFAVIAYATNKGVDPGNVLVTIGEMVGIITGMLLAIGIITKAFKMDGKSANVDNIDNILNSMAKIVLNMGIAIGVISWASKDNVAAVSVAGNRLLALMGIIATMVVGVAALSTKVDIKKTDPEWFKEFGKFIKSFKSIINSMMWFTVVISLATKDITNTDALEIAAKSLNAMSIGLVLVIGAMAYLLQDTLNKDSSGNGSVSWMSSEGPEFIEKITNLIKTFANYILKLGLSIALVAITVSKLPEEATGNFNKTIKIIAAMTGILAILIGYIAYLSANTTSDDSIHEFGSEAGNKTIDLLTNAISQFSLFVISVAGGLALITAVASKFPDGFTQATMVVGVALAVIALIVGALAYISSTKDEKSIGNLKNGNAITEIGNMFAKLSAGILMIAAGLALLSTMPADSIEKAGYALALVTAILGIFGVLGSVQGFEANGSKFIDVLGESFIKMAKSVLIFNGALFIGAWALKLLLNNWDAFRDRFLDEKNAKETTTVIKHMFDSLLETLEGFLEKLVDVILAFLKHLLVDSLPTIVDMVADSIVKLLEILKKRPDVIASAIELIYEVIKQTFDALSDILFKVLGDVFDAQGHESAAKFFKSMTNEAQSGSGKKWKKAITDLVGAVGTILVLSKPAKNIAHFFSLFTSKTKDAQKVVETAANVAGNAAVEGAEKAAETVENVGEAATKAATNSGNAFVKAFGAVKNFIAANPELAAILALVAATVVTVKMIIDIKTEGINVNPDSEEYTETLERIRKQHERTLEAATKATEATRAYLEESTTLSEETEKKITRANAEYEYYDILRKKLEDITTSAGQFSDANKELAESIVNELNSAYGTNMQIVDNMIIKYQEEMDTLDQLITKQRNANILEALDADEVLDYSKVTERDKQILENLNAIESLRNEGQEIINERNALNDKLKTNYWYAGSDISELDRDTLEKQIRNAETRMNVYQSYMDSIRSTYELLPSGAGDYTEDEHYINDKYYYDYYKLRKEQYEGALALMDQWDAFNAAHVDFDEGRIQMLEQENEQLVRQQAHYKELQEYYAKAQYWMDKDNAKFESYLAKIQFDLKTSKSATGEELKEQYDTINENYQQLVQRYNETGVWASETSRSTWVAILNEARNAMITSSANAAEAGKATVDRYAESVGLQKDRVLASLDKTLSPSDFLNSAQYKKYLELLADAGENAADYYALGIYKAKERVAKSRADTLYATPEMLTEYEYATFKDLISEVGMAEAYQYMVGTIASRGESDISMLMQARQNRILRMVDERSKYLEELKHGADSALDSLDKEKDSIDWDAWQDWSSSDKESFISKLASDLDSKTKSQFDSISDYADKTLSNISPTITPIIDLDEATSQISGLGALFNSNFSGGLADSINATEYLQRMAGGNDELLDKINMLTDALNGSTIVPEGTTFQFDSILDGKVVSKTLAPNLDILAGQNMLLSGRGGSIPR